VSADAFAICIYIAGVASGMVSVAVASVVSAYLSRWM
jgi:hypothetical protein